MSAHNEALIHSPLALVKVTLLKRSEIPLSQLLRANNSLSTVVIATLVMRTAGENRLTPICFFKKKEKKKTTTNANNNKTQQTSPPAPTSPVCMNKPSPPAPYTPKLAIPGHLCGHEFCISLDRHPKLKAHFAELISTGIFGMFGVLTLTCCLEKHHTRAPREPGRITLR